MSVLDQIQNGNSQVWEKLNDKGLEGCTLTNLKQAIAENPALKEKLSILAVKPDGTPDVSAWKPDNQFDGGDGYNYKEKFTIKDNKPDAYKLIRWKSRQQQQSKAAYTTAMVASFRLGQEQELNQFLEEHLRTAPQRIVDVEQHVIELVESRIKVNENTEKPEEAQGNEDAGGGSEQQKYHKSVESWGQTIVYTALVKQKV